MTQYVGANPASWSPAGKCLPGVSEFQAWHMNEWGLPTFGCYNPGSVLPDGTPSLHRDGRAEDVGHDWSEEQIDLVWELCNRLVAGAETLGVQQIIYRGMFWREAGGWRFVSPSTDQHLSHAHVEFTPSGAFDNYYANYQETLGEPPMKQNEIDALAKGIAKAIMEYPIEGYDHANGVAATYTFSQWTVFQNQELQLARLALQRAQTLTQFVAAPAAFASLTHDSTTGLEPSIVVGDTGDQGTTEATEPEAAPKDLPTDDPAYRAE